MARAWTGVDTVEAPVTASGEFALAVPKSALDSTVVFVGGALGQDDEVLPSLHVFPSFAEDIDVRVLLVPREWTVEGGAYDGTTVPVSLQTLIAPENAGQDGAFFGVWPSPERTEEEPALALWTATWPDFPIPVFFAEAGADRDGVTNAEVSESDSVAAWRTIELLEETVGMDLFAPADRSTLAIDTVADNPVRFGAIRVRLAAGAWAYVQVPCRQRRPLPAGFPPLPEDLACKKVHEGNIGWSVVAIPSIWEPFAVQHEFMHALGFGHSCFHPSLMSYCVGPFGMQHLPADRSYNIEASPYDVAYLQLYTAIHRRSREVRPHWGLVEALDGERRLLAGLGPIPAMWWDRMIGF